MHAGARALLTAFSASGLFWMVPIDCGRPVARATDAGLGDAVMVSVPSAASAGSGRPGMVWIPPGEFRAGTPPNKTPRVAEEELPGTRVALGGYYIDVLPFPNEAGAIPTLNVSREDAAHMCESKGKRLCSELEWEHACKGPADAAYEDGDVYHPATCAMGMPSEQAARRPSGEQLACKSGFGVSDMHGGAWEWTDGPWGRGSSRDLGVLRGGNAMAGEIAGRCANALARLAKGKSPTMGFRCCAGPKNDVKVELALQTGTALERSMKTAELTAPLLPFARRTWAPASDARHVFAFVHAFVWRPVPNEELLIASGCAKDLPHPRCGVLVERMASDLDVEDRRAAASLAQIDTGFVATEVAEVGDARHLRVKGVDAVSAYLRDLTYAYGRVEIGEIRR
jgi:formylglycine-generating enzyme required for sulfatase activity